MNKDLKGNLLFAQSGGPTAVINSGAAGVFIEAMRHPDRITGIYGAKNGILGVLNEEFYDIGQEDPEELKKLCNTPSSFLGSCRKKLSKLEDDDSEYARILEVFKKYNIRMFFYNGGNDSMDTCNKVSKYLASHDYECTVIGIPKTIDNDLALTDHCPGFASAARYIASTIAEVALDAAVYDIPQLTIVEIMGRNAGWLTAAAGLASLCGKGPDLLYFPERAFDLDRARKDIKDKLQQNSKVLIGIAEGVKTADGKYLPELSETLETDSFGHKQMGGTALELSKILAKDIDCKIRTIELSLMQRCAAHLASGLDVDECFEAGRAGVLKALEGRSDLMVGFKRDSLDLPYLTEIAYFPLGEVANTEKKLPDNFINEEGNGITKEFINYCLPLIQGDPGFKFEKALPSFAKLKLKEINRE